MPTRARLALALLPLLAACAEGDPAGEGAKAQTGDRQRDEDSGGGGVSAVAGADGVALTPGADDASSWVSVESTASIVASTTFSPDGGLSGSLSYRSQLGDDVICDVEVALGGAPWAGDCEGCDFAFDVEASLVADRSAEGCWAPTLYTLLDDPASGTHSPLVAFWSSMTTPVYTWDDGYGGTSSWGGYTYTDLFKIGYSATFPAYDGPYGYYPGGTYGPWWTPWSVGTVSGGVGGGTGYLYGYGLDGYGYDSTPYTTRSATRTEAGLSWGLSSAYMTYAGAFGSVGCEGSSGDEAAPAAAAAGDASVTGSLPCAGPDEIGDTGASWTQYWLEGAYDAHSFTGTAGEEVQVTVDTVAADSAFDPVAYVLGPSDCLLAFQDSGVDCSFAPAWGQCPSFKVELPEDGDYTVIVSGWSTCNGPTAAYQLDVVRR